MAELGMEYMSLVRSLGLPEACAKYTRPDYDNPKVDRKQYPYIPLPAPTAEAFLKFTIRKFQQRRRRAPRTFLEVGCGFGIVTHIAQTRLGLDASGFDIMPEYVERSKFYLKGKFFEANALTFPDYGKYDIVYFYQPFLNNRLRLRFCRKLAREVKGFVAPVYGLHGTPFDFQSPNEIGGLRWDAKSDCPVYPRGTKFPFYLHYPFVPYDGSRKELVFGQKADWWH